MRSAYRNESDFQLQSLDRTRPAVETRRFDRIIDPDQAVSDNYRRLAWKRISDMDYDAPDDTTFGQYRSESLGKLREAMAALFKKPTLNLESFGGVQDSGTFLFSKGASKQFRYSNLSGGEKAAFDLLLDIFVKRQEYQDAVYCIDEPEAHMAAALQGPLLDAMLDLLPEKIPDVDRNPFHRLCSPSFRQDARERRRRVSGLCRARLRSRSGDQPSNNRSHLLARNLSHRARRSVRTHSAQDDHSLRRQQGKGPTRDSTPSATTESSLTSVRMLCSFRSATTSR